MVLRETSTSSKFAKIICASFTSESSLVQAIEKTRAANILVNTDLKKSTGCLDWAVQKAVVEFEQMDQIDLAVAEWFILIRKDAVCVAKANIDKVL
ncbi:hypothetical protein G9A89_018343 [Geosiphon pyriformis]|nr:hypothetical protein G9A89_018343 [Geosiphon pyriformis]